MLIARRFFVALALVVLPAAGLSSVTWRTAHAGAQADSVPTFTIPYVDEIHIGPFDRAICPGESIKVAVRGRFPNTCFSFRKIEMIPVRRLTGPMMIRIVVDDGSCKAQICGQVMVPWSADITLPPLQEPNAYALGLEMWRTTCNDSMPPDSSIFHGVAFFKVAQCVQPHSCLLGDWVHPDGECDAQSAPGQRARVTFTVSSSVALAGLQGAFRVEPGPVKSDHEPQPAVARIVGIEPVGPAQGMRLTWAPLPDGARFALFAEHGAPIPPAVAFPDSTHHDSSGFALGVPVLRVTVQQDSLFAAPMTFVQAYDLLGADSLAQGVPECPVFDRPYPPIARICNDHGCDANDDGLTDIRDIVLEVHCFNGEGPCPDSTGVYDCNRDGHSGLDDVVCCARKVLRDQLCPDCPVDTSTARPAPGVHLSLRSPVFTPGGVDVTVHLDGAEVVGGATLSLAFPGDRYALGSVEFVDDPAWLHLSDSQPGAALIGLIQLPAPDRAPQSGLDFTLHLALKPGKSHGGEVVATGGEFSASDGVQLDVSLGHPSLELGGPTIVTLSDTRPNPFGVETRFSVTLDRTVDVEVGVYDLSGRLITTLHRGPLDPGVHEFLWNGRRGDGTPAENGVYFYRAMTTDRGSARKVILLRGN